LRGQLLQAHCSLQADGAHPLTDILLRGRRHRPFPFLNIKLFLI
jgi:hypothetical protein